MIGPSDAVFERDKEQSRVYKEQGRLTVFIVFRCTDPLTNVTGYDCRASDWWLVNALIDFLGYLPFVPLRGSV